MELVENSPRILQRPVFLRNQFGNKHSILRVHLKVHAHFDLTRKFLI